MTLEQASATWKTSGTTICKWICEGLINNISLKENKLILPDIPKPRIVRKNIEITAEKAYKEILEACNKNEYIDAYLLRISEDQFVNYITILKQNGLLNGYGIDSNIGYSITTKGIDFIKSKKRKFDFNVNFNTQIGLANIKM